MTRGGLFGRTGRRSTERLWIGRLAAAGAGLLAVAGVGAMLWYVPHFVVDHDAAGAGIATRERLTALNTVRAILLSAVVSLVACFGAYAVWRHARVGRDTVRVIQEGAVTDRFSRAVEQLGSGNVDVRIGGIHALRRTAEHSPGDHEAVLAILTAYLRTHIPWPPADSAAAQTPINDLPPLESRAPDAQAALTALGVLCQDRQQAWVNLGRTDLRRADCDGLWLHEITLDRACLEAATFYEANLSWTSIVSGNLRHATFTRAVLHDLWAPGADLRGATALDADLRGAHLSGSDLREAILRRANLRDAILAGADLRDADVRGADFTGAQLRDTQLAGAIADDRTTWPKGFDTAAAGLAAAEDPDAEPEDPAVPPTLLRNVKALRTPAG
jgi:uncharacterized protein YjbI with pentapeptide repeats